MPSVPLERRYYNRAAAATFAQVPEGDRLFVVAEMERLRKAPFYGKPLERELRDCRSVYVFVAQSTAGIQADYRIVYRLWPDDRNPERIDVIAIGPRIGMAAYDLARGVLGRSL